MTPGESDTQRAPRGPHSSALRRASRWTPTLANAYAMPGSSLSPKIASSSGSSSTAKRVRRVRGRSPGGRPSRRCTRRPCRRRRGESNASSTRAMPARSMSSTVRASTCTGETPAVITRASSVSTCSPTWRPQRRATPDRSRSQNTSPPARSATNVVPARSGAVAAPIPDAPPMTMFMRANPMSMYPPALSDLRPTDNILLIRGISHYHASPGERSTIPATIPAAVMASVARRGSVEAVVDGEQRVTYSELGERIIEATRAMIAAGVSSGDRVAIWAPNGLGWIVAALGAQSQVRRSCRSTPAGRAARRPTCSTPRT